MRLTFLLVMAPHFCKTNKISSCDFRMILGLPLCEEDNQQLSKNISSYGFCKLPSQYIGVVKETMKCDLLKKYNPKCSRNITMAYTGLPPYVDTHKDGTVNGLIMRKLIHSL